MHLRMYMYILAREIVGKIDKYVRITLILHRLSLLYLIFYIRVHISFVKNTAII